MTPGDAGQVLRRWWWLLALTTVGGILAGIGINHVAAPRYQAQSQLLVSVRPAEGVDDEITGIHARHLSAQSRIPSYLRMVDSPAVLGRVVDKLDLPMTASQLADQVSSENPAKTVLITVLALDGDAAQAARIADATAESLAEEVVFMETTGSGATPVDVDSVFSAAAPSTPVLPRTGMNLVIGALIGMSVGLGIAHLRTPGGLPARAPRARRGAGREGPRRARRVPFTRSPARI